MPSACLPQWVRNFPRRGLLSIILRRCWWWWSDTVPPKYEGVSCKWKLQMAQYYLSDKYRWRVAGMMVGEIPLDNRDQLGMAVHTCLGLSILSWGSGGLHICRKNIYSYFHVGKIPEGPCRNLMEGRATIETTKTISKNYIIETYMAG